MARNYYVIPGIAPDATQEAVKSAYRRHAKELHPNRERVASLCLPSYAFLFAALFIGPY